MSSHENIEDILESRNSEYGSFAVGTKLLADIADLIEQAHMVQTNVLFTPVERVHIYYMLMKLVRLSSSPNHIDTWTDISGYSLLISKTLKEQKNAKKD